MVLWVFDGLILTDFIHDYIELIGEVVTRSPSTPLWTIPTLKMKFCVLQISRHYDGLLCLTLRLRSRFPCRPNFSPAEFSALAEPLSGCRRINRLLYRSLSYNTMCKGGREADSCPSPSLNPIRFARHEGSNRPPDHDDRLLRLHFTTFSSVLVALLLAYPVRA